MVQTAPNNSRSPSRTFWDLVRPREHGSWSLVLEPLVFGLIIFPSFAGLIFCLAVLSLFLARRPWQRHFADEGVRRRQAVRVFCSLVVLGAALAGLALIFRVGKLCLTNRVFFLSAMVSVGAAIFSLCLEGRPEKRTLVGEVAGAFAASSKPLFLGFLAGSTPNHSLLASVFVCARCVVSVIAVRNAIRVLKGIQCREHILALIILLLSASLLIALRGSGPVVAVAWIALVSILAKLTTLRLSLALSTDALDRRLTRTSKKNYGPRVSIAARIWPLCHQAIKTCRDFFPASKSELSARRIGIAEAAFGVGYVLALGFPLHAIVSIR
jgi:hypothetical protein